MNADNIPLFCIYCHCLSQSQAALTTHSLIDIANPETKKQNNEITNQIAMKVKKDYTPK